MQSRVKTFLVEDDNDFAYLISNIVSQDKRLHFAGHATERAKAIELVTDLRPDVVLMDLNLTGDELDGVDAAREIRITTGAKILLLTSFEQHDIMIYASKRAFASGYIYKSDCVSLAEIIFKTATTHTPQEGFIRELLLGELSSAERSVLAGILKGEMTSISASSLKTIANQKTSIFKKLGLKNTNELISVFKNWI